MKDDLVSGWSPGQAVTPGECSPGCEACKPACCQHGAPRTETTTGIGESWTGTGQQGEPVEVPGSARPPAADTDTPETRVARNWDEDFTHENGDYLCQCVTCGKPFIGHKRRVVCRSCAMPSSVPATPAAEPGEMSRKAFEHTISVSGASSRLRTVLLAHDAALRARAERERQRAEAYVSECNERADKLIAMHSATVRRAERDEAREQRAAATKRAERAEQSLGALGAMMAEQLHDEALEAAAVLVRDLRSRLATAEAEEKRVRALIGSRTGRTLSDAVHDAMTSLREYHEGRLHEEKCKLKAAEAETTRLKGVLHLDRSGLANALNRVRDEARGRRWIPAGEWGSYEYTEQTVETLRKEIGWLLDGVERVAAEALAASGDLAHAECCGGERKEARYRTTMFVDATEAALARWEAARGEKGGA